MHLITEMKMKSATEQQGWTGWIASAVRWLKTPAERAQRKHLRVVETLTIGAKKQLVLVSCDGERFLVGTGAEGVGTITRVRPELVAGARVEGAVR